MQGTPALSQSGIAADALLKGTITRLATEDSSPEKCREEASAKGHVIYEGKSGHILSYDGEYLYVLLDESQDCSGLCSSLCASKCMDINLSHWVPPGRNTDLPVCFCGYKD